MATWDDVAVAVDLLPLAGESAPREWRVGRKLIAWERPLRTPDHHALTVAGIEVPRGDILAIRVADEIVKRTLITDEPETYFTTPHFDGYPAVLVRLDVVDARHLRQLITDAWLTQAPKRLVQEFLGHTG